jgi:hypothetical protein
MGDGMNIQAMKATQRRLNSAIGRFGVEYPSAARNLDALVMGRLRGPKSCHPDIPVSLGVQSMLDSSPMIPKIFTIRSC